MDGARTNCWVRKVMEIVIFQNFFLLLASFAGKYTRESNATELSDEEREIILYSIIGTFVMMCLVGLLLFCKPICRSKNPLNCMMLTVMTFFSLICAFLITFYTDVIELIIGYSGVIFVGVFIIFYASICNEREVTSWYLSIFSIVFCCAIAAGMLYASYVSNPEISDDEETVFRLYGLVPNLATVIATPFLLSFFVCRREGFCGETIEAALYVLYPWLILYDPFTRCECY